MIKRLNKILLLTSLILILHTILLSQQKYKFIYEHDPVEKITVSFAGDLMCHSPQFQFARVKKDSFDFKPVYRYIKPLLDHSDFVIGNLETVLGGNKKEYRGYPLFNTPDDYLEGLSYAGFDMLITSNNHAMDQKKKGLLRTIKKIKEKGFYQTGTFNSLKERDSVKIYDIKGIKFTVLAYTWSTNGIPVPDGEEYLINIIDTAEIHKDILKAKQYSPDFIITYFHFGNEYKTEPSYYQKRIVKRTISYGADIIIASHPHVVQPVEYFKTNNGNIDTGFVAYSLGNFYSNQRWRYSDGGPVLSFQISKNVKKDSTYLSGIQITPAWVFKGNTGNKNEYVILPSDSVVYKNQYNFLTKKDRKNLLQSYNDTFGIMSGKTKQIQYYSPSAIIRKYFKIPFIIN